MQRRYHLQDCAITTSTSQIHKITSNKFANVLDMSYSIRSCVHFNIHFIGPVEEKNRIDAPLVNLQFVM